MAKDTQRQAAPKRQHYVPQFLLRNFAARASDRVWVFDKKTDKAWHQAVREVGHETYFNEAPLGDGLYVSYEDRFQYLENEVAPVLAKLNAGALFYSLTVMEFVSLCFFIAIQHLRTPAHLSDVKGIFEAIRRLFPDGQMSESLQEQVGPLTDDAAKLHSLDTVFSTTEHLVKALVPKAWLLYEALPTRTFYIGDAPVTLYNERRDGLRSFVGFAVPGIEVYTPISATLLLMSA